MSLFPLDGFDGYTARTFAFKSTLDGDILADVVYPIDINSSAATVLIHYHGGFLIVGDRYSFLPYWLVHATTTRKWIFVSPDYRLIPETTGHSAVEDAVDALNWVQSSLPGLLNCTISSTLVAGASAGGYLALTTAVAATRKPDAVLLTYGMLDLAGSRYTTPGSNVFGAPVIDTAPVFRDYPKRKQNEDRKVISAYPLRVPPPEDPRFALAGALHIDARLPDYLTGVDGLGLAIGKDGISAIPKEHRYLFPVAYGDLANMPPTMLLHGVNDSAVPIDNSIKAAEKLRAVGVTVVTEFPEDAEHGFDDRAGNVNIETGGDDITAVESLRRVVKFLDSAASKA